MGYIYKATNKVNGKVYIGKTENDIKIRWAAHVSSSFNKRSREYSFKFHNAIRKYGKDAFDVEVIDDVEPSETASREQYWIEFYDSIKSGYNTTFGGEGSTRYSDELFLSCWKSGMTIGEIQRKYGISRNTVSARCREFVSREEIHDRTFQRLKEKNGTPVYQYDLNGNYIGEYCSANEARRQTKINHIDATARGERNKAGGYIWSYIKCDKIDPASIKRTKRGDAA